MLYIRLFHGRLNPQKDMDNWGSDGPVFGPYSSVHVTYTSLVRLVRNCGSCDELFIVEHDLIFYGNVYYGDWIVFSGEIYNKPEIEISEFEQDKANYTGIADS